MGRPISNEEKSLNLDNLKGSVIEVLGGLTDINVAIFGSAVEQPAGHIINDIDVWLEGAESAENDAAHKLTSHTYTSLGYHAITAGEFKSMPELAKAMRYKVATNGAAVVGKLPSVPPEYTEQVADEAFRLYHLNTARQLVERAYVLNQAGAWSNGSHTVEALRLWLHAQRPTTEDWRAIKNFDQSQIESELANLYPQLQGLISAEGWADPNIIRFARELILSARLDPGCGEQA